MQDMTLPEDFCANPEYAFTLPARYYTSQAVFEEEASRILGKSWICVAHCSEVALNNQFITRTLLGENIAIVRGRDAVLRGFYNVCPHRGHELLSGSGVAKNLITCPYHAWAFKLDGELSHARNCENVEKFDAKSNSLVSVRVQEYAGFVFVNLDAHADDVETQLPGLAEKIKSTYGHVEKLHMAARYVTRTPANWKVIVDNYMECYHCAPAHPGFSDSVRMDRYTHTFGGNWTLQHGYARSSEKSFKLDANVENQAFSGFWAWPCTMFNFPPGDGLMTVIYELPVDAHTTLQHYEIYFANKELTTEQLALVDWYREVFRPEDLRLVESVQRGLGSRGYRGQGRIMVDKARSGISEHGIAHFHALVAKALRL